MLNLSQDGVKRRGRVFARKHVFHDKNIHLNFCQCNRVANRVYRFKLKLKGMVKIVIKEQQISDTMPLESISIAHVYMSVKSI